MNLKIPPNISYNFNVLAEVPFKIMYQIMIFSLSHKVKKARERKILILKKAKKFSFLLN